MAGKQSIVCVQPNCGRVTADFYRVDPKTAAELTDVQSGETCSSCYEDIVRRATREGIPGKSSGAPKCPRD